MLWREGFRPDIRFFVRTPIELAQFELVIGVFALSALPQLEIWRRLALESQLNFIEGIWLAPTDEAQLPLLLAPSRLARAHVGANRSEWLAALDPMPIDRAFATTSATTIIGPCTEDAWELMLNRLKDPASNAQ